MSAMPSLPGHDGLARLVARAQSLINESADRCARCRWALFGAS